MTHSNIETFLKTYKEGNDANRVLSAGLRTLEVHYIIGNIKGGAQTETIDYQRKGAIDKFLKGSTMTWKECEKVGWRCFKVDIVFQPCR
jgi:coenzyme F420-reducing hydrogenase delta subunit